jgi:hypothetical protein
MAKTKEATNNVANDFTAIIKRLEKLAGSGGYPTLVISPAKNKTVLSATNNGIVVETQINEVLEGLTGPWSFPYATLTSLIGNRSGVVASLNESTLMLTAKGFNASLAGTEASSIPRAKPPEVNAVSFKIDGELRLLMVEALQAVNLQKSLPALPDIVVNIQLDKKVSITAFDKSQMANFSRTNPTKQKFDFTLPLPKAEALFKGTLGDANVVISEGVMYAESGMFKMTMSLPPLDELTPVPIERVINRVAELRKMKLPRSVSMSKSGVANFLESARVLSKASAMIKMSVKSKGSTLTLTADGNSVEANIKTQSDEEFVGYIDLYYLQAILQKCSEDQLSISLDDTLFIFNSESLVYSAVLSTPAKETKETKETKKAKKAKKGSSED